MDGGEIRGCNAYPIMDNATSLIACEGNYNDFHASAAVKVGKSPSFPCDDCVNTIPGMVERRIHASELAKPVGELGAVVKETNEIGVEEGGRKMVAQEERDAFPGLSPLSGGDVVGSSSSIGIGLEAEYISRVFEHGRDSSYCEKSLLVSSRLVVDSLVVSDEDLAKKGDGFCCPTISSECIVISRNSNGNRAEGNNLSPSVGESQSLNSDRCSANERCLENIRKEDSQQLCSQNGQGLPLQYIRKQKQARKKFFCTYLYENDAHHQEIIEKESFGAPQVDHEVSCSAQGSNSEPTYCSSTEKFISENPSHSSTSLACCSSGALEPDIMRSNFDASKGSSTCCSSSICCGEAERVAIKKPGFLSFVRRSNPRRAASLRDSLPITYSSELTMVRRDRRKCKRGEDASTFLSLSAVNMFSEVKRKRRSSQRQARLSAWGKIEGLFNIIEQNNESKKNDPEPNVFGKKGSKKVKSGRNRRKRTPVIRNEQSWLSSNKKASSSSKIVAAVLHDAKASSENNSEHLMPASDGHTSIGYSDSKFEFGQNLFEKCRGDSFRAIQRDGQQGDKDLDSTSTQETSSYTHQFDCHGILSQVDLEPVAETIDTKRSLDSGTSPDSDVYNPPTNVHVLTLDGSTAIKQEDGLEQKVLIEESKTEDGLLCSAATSADPFAESLSVLVKEMRVCENPSRRNSKRSQKSGKPKKGKKDGQISKCMFPFSDHHSVEERLDFLKEHNEVRKASVSSNCCQKDEPASHGVKGSKSVRKNYKKGYKPEMRPVNSSLPAWDDLDCSGRFLEVQTNTEASTLTLENVIYGQSDAIVRSGDVKGCQIPNSADVKGCLISERSKMRLNKGKSSRAHSANNKKKFSRVQQKGKRWKSDNQKKADPFPEENNQMVLSQGINNKLSVSGGEQSADVGESTGVSTVLKDASNCVTTSVSSELSDREFYNGLLEQSLLSGKKAWALCDDCQKWRCVPDELVHVIEKNRWTCRDNVDEAFADCAIPQEKTDDEINIDLGISDEEYCSVGQPSYLQTEPQRTAARRTTWSLIKSNLYRHRNRRTQTIDEIMVCHCKPPHHGSLGCADECLNRMLNIECVKGTCPCGDLCSNQQFQKRKYTKFKWIQCGKKGYGLQLEEDVTQGQFLIEYVGEVLDITAYEARLRDYASRGQKHFYFMTLNGGEVIDACGKGNLGRFINHSCDPNCRTEKWMVKGEVCIGLFAIRDIKKGEEVTFDYNYVRVFGAAAKKCVCGSAECRGYIGGDPTNSEVIVQDDSDEEELEPIMIDEVGAIELGVLVSDSKVPNTNVDKQENISVERDEKPKKLTEQGSLIEKKDVMHQLSSQLNLRENIIPSSDCIDSKFNMSEASLEIQKLKQVYSDIKPDQTSGEPINDYPLFNTIPRPIDSTVLLEKSKYDLNPSQTDHTEHVSLYDGASKICLQTFESTLQEKRLTSCITEELPSVSKVNISVKPSRSIKIKRSRVSLKSMASLKTKKIPNALSTRHVEGVEEKLNELLDEDGGISRQKDSAKGYLKLLVVTAAAGDDIRGSTSQSARDLSMILDAILKTKSRMVLVDIINKNGLQMLHNILKQNRENFNRIPILRKLLKVLEFLAEKQILSREHINGPPPCTGMESFKESMLDLVKHRDFQVHAIARNFADQWIPRTIRVIEPTDRDGRLQSSKRFCINWCPATNFKSWQDPRNLESDAVVCVSSATCPPTSLSEADKSNEVVRLPSEQVSVSASLPDNSRSMNNTRRRKRKSRWDQPSDELEKPCSLSESTSNVEVPKQRSGTQSEVICSDEANAVEEYRHHNSNIDDEDDDEMPPGFASTCADNHPQVPCFSKGVDKVLVAHPQERYAPHLRVSYGMPVLLMEQLGTPETGGSSRCNSSWVIAPAMPFKPFPPLPSYPRKESNMKTTGNEAFNGNMTIFPQKNQRLRCFNNGNGRKFFQPCHWNDQRSRRCWSKWPHERNSHRFDGKSGNGGSGSDVGNLRRGGGGFSCPEGINPTVVHSNFSQSHHNT